MALWPPVGGRARVVLDLMCHRAWPWSRHGRTYPQSARRSAHGLADCFRGAMPVWKRFLACFYGGLCEETLMRLFLLSLVMWLLGKFWKAPSGLPASGAFWTANILVAVAFGAGHLPLASQLTVLTPLLVTAIISLNGIVGLGFGYLYWKRGLESAMLAHFSADIVLHVLSPDVLAVGPEGRARAFLSPGWSAFCFLSAQSS